MSGDGMSGLPNPRSTTSAPARRASIFSPLMMEKTYGGRFSMRRNSMALTLSGGAHRTVGRMPKTPSEGCIHVIIEIPRGSRNKYEIDHEDGRVYLDRRLFTATTY